VGRYIQVNVEPVRYSVVVWI